MKYIVLRRRGPGDLSVLVPVVFPNNEVHSQVAEALLAHATFAGCEVVSAGNCSLMCAGVGGESETLGLSSRGHLDRVLIEACDYGAGIICGEEDL